MGGGGGGGFGVLGGGSGRGGRCTDEPCDFSVGPRWRCRRSPRRRRTAIRQSRSSSIVPLAAGGGIDFTARADRAEALRRARPAGGGRESGRRRRHARRQRGRARRARRLHAALSFGIRRGERRGRQGPALRLAQGSGAGVAGHPLRAGADHQSCRSPRKTSRNSSRWRRPIRASSATARPAPGTAIHLASELFKAAAGVDIVHVPYRGNAGVMPDLLAGRIAMLIDGVPPQQQEHRIRRRASARR